MHIWKVTSAPSPPLRVINLRCLYSPPSPVLPSPILACNRSNEKNKRPINQRIYLFFNRMGTLRSRYNLPLIFISPSILWCSRIAGQYLFFKLKGVLLSGWVRVVSWPSQDFYWLRNFMQLRCMGLFNFLFIYLIALFYSFLLKRIAKLI